MTFSCDLIHPIFFAVWNHNKELNVEYMKDWRANSRIQYLDLSIPEDINIL